MRPPDSYGDYFENLLPDGTDKTLLAVRMLRAAVLTIAVMVTHAVHDITDGKEITR